jgi:hypothetical protein
MKISKLEYVKMQVMVSGEYSFPGDVKRRIDTILDLNGITVNDEPEVKPMTNDEFNQMARRCTSDSNWVSWPNVFQELKKRGLVV